MGSAAPTTGRRTGGLRKKRSPGDWRRLERRRHARLVEALREAEKQLAIAEALGFDNDVERLRADIHGRSYVDFAEGLRYEIRLLEVAVRDQRVVELCAAKGITAAQLADYQRRHERRAGPAPDENPGKRSPDYGGLQLHKMQPTGRQGSMAR